MQPPSRSPARTASANLVGDNDIVFLEIVLRPVGEDVADDPVLADDFLSQADAANELSGRTVVFRTLDTEFHKRKRAVHIVAFQLSHGFWSKFNDSVHFLVVDSHDLALVAKRNGCDGCAAAYSASLLRRDCLGEKFLEVFYVLL